MGRTSTFTLFLLFLQPWSASGLYKVEQVHIIHRHGDRTPITPMQNKDFWASTLPNAAMLHKLSEGTKLLRRNNANPHQKKEIHAAVGRGPFGQLTSLGLLQMVQLGTRLREDLVSNQDNEEDHRRNQALFDPSRPLTPASIRIVSTDFPRTIQSVRGVLVGLFPDLDAKQSTPLQIDVRHTAKYIPDPQPRMSPEQIRLEANLSQRKEIVEQEAHLLPLAQRTTLALQSILAPREAKEVSSGLNFGQNKELHEKDSNPATTPLPPLPWPQLAEICHCLQVRQQLPPSITPKDVTIIQQHAAWKWFAMMRHPRMAHLAMGEFVKDICHWLHLGAKGTATTDSAATRDFPRLHLYSAHDSTLIGLLCALDLEQPAEWPGYGSFLKIELLSCCRKEQDDENEPLQFMVRCSLNDKVLRFIGGKVSNENDQGVKDDDSVNSDHDKDMVVPLELFTKWVKRVPPPVPSK